MQGTHAHITWSLPRSPWPEETYLTRCMVYIHVYIPCERLHQYDISIHSCLFPASNCVLVPVQTSKTGLHTQNGTDRSHICNSTVTLAYERAQLLASLQLHHMVGLIPAPTMCSHLDKQVYLHNLNKLCTPHKYCITVVYRH